MHAGRDNAWPEIDRKYYGITKMEIAFLLKHCATYAKTRSVKTAAPLEPVVVNDLVRLQIDLIDFRHLDQKHSVYLCVITSASFSFIPYGNKESENVAFYLGGFIGLFGILRIFHAIMEQSLKEHVIIL